MKNALELIIGLLLLPLLTLQDAYKRLTKQNQEPWDDWDSAIYTIAFTIFISELGIALLCYVTVKLYIL